MNRQTVVALCVAGLVAAGSIHALDLDQAALQAMGIGVEDPLEAQLAALDARTLDWLDLIPPPEAATAARTRDGNLPRGVVQHGEMGPTGSSGPEGTPPALAKLLGGYGNLDAPPRRMSDAFGGLGTLKALQPRAGSIRQELDGQPVRIAGFVTPLGFDGSRVSEFLLVPYVGACIHVPPPPPNQIVFVSDLHGYQPEGGLLYPVWVTGTLRAVPLETDLADVGYQIKGARIERYE